MSEAPHYHDQTGRTAQRRGQVLEWVSNFLRITLGPVLPVLIAKRVLGLEPRFRAWWARFVATHPTIGDATRVFGRVHIAAYYGLGLALLGLDWAVTPRGKIQTTRFVELRTVPKMLALTMFNMVALPGLLSRASKALGVPNPFGVTRHVRYSPELPSLATVAAQLVAHYVLYEFIFFHGHWLLHQKPFWWIHKIHHEYKAPSAIMSTYAHPIEHATTAIWPVAVWAALCKPHYLTLQLAEVQAILATFVAHLGYRQGGILSRFHDRHHSGKKATNFGAVGALDWLYGTYAVDAVQQHPEESPAACP